MAVYHCIQAHDIFMIQFAGDKKLLNISARFLVFNSLLVLQKIYWQSLIPGWDGEGIASSFCSSPASSSSPTSTSPLPSWRLPLPIPPIPIIHPPCAEVRRQEEETKVAVSILGGLLGSLLGCKLLLWYLTLRSRSELPGGCHVLGYEAHLLLFSKLKWRQKKQLKCW